MATMIGKYAYVKEENLAKFYKSLNVPQAFVDKLIPEYHSVKQFEVDGNKITMSGTYKADFILEKEVDETNEYNYTLKSTAKMEGSKLIVTSSSPEKPNTVLQRVYEPSEKKLIITMTCDKTPVIAKFYYKRINLHCSS